MFINTGIYVVVVVNTGIARKGVLTCTFPRVHVSCILLVLLPSSFAELGKKLREKVARTLRPDSELAMGVMTGRGWP